MLSRRRKSTPNKETLFQAVEANPGLSMSQLVKLTGVPAWAAQKILPELAAHGLIHYRLEHPEQVRKRKWYAGKKPAN